MIVLQQVSGVDTPQTNKGHLFAFTNNHLGWKTPDGVVSYTYPLSLASGLTDVTGTFTAGTSPVFDGTVFRPAAAAAASTPVYTKSTTGIVKMQAVLASGVIPNGGAATTIIFSGFDSTYDWLEIRGVVRSNAATTAIDLKMYFNNDTTNTNYVSRRWNNTFGSFSVLTTDATVFAANALSMQNSDGGIVSPIHVFIPDYATANHRKYGYTPAASVINYNITSISQYWSCTQWENTSGPAINMIEIRGDNAVTTFTSGTDVYLIGHKTMSVNLSGSYDNVHILNGHIIP